MAKTKASDVWHKPIKFIGNGFIEFIARCADQGASRFVGHAMQMGDIGEWIVYATAVADYQGGFLEVAEEIADDDRYFLAKRAGCKILHNQKLAGAYVIGDGVVQTSTGTWTLMDKDTAGHMLMKAGIVVGPADRVTATVIKDIDDALTATEPVDILI